MSPAPRAVVFGSGHSALTLATGLLDDGWRVDVFTRHSTPEILGNPAGLTQLTLPSVHATELALGLGLWQHTAPPAHEVRMRMAPPEGEAFSFTAPLPGPAVAVDHRLKSAYWLQHVANRGGRVHERTCTSGDVAGFASSRLHDLVVVAPGVDSDLRHLFSPDPDRTGGATDRVLVQVHLAVPDELLPERAEVLTCPWGEVMVYPVLTVDGLAPSQVRALSALDAPPVHVTPYAALCVQVMARPHSPLDPASTITPEGDDSETGSGLPRRHGAHARAAWAHVLDQLPALAPELAGLCAQGRVISGSELVREVHPQVRRPVTTIAGTPVVGIGDATMTVEHASGQGAGASTWVASTLRDQIRQQRQANGALDSAFLTGAWEAYWARHGQYTSAFGGFVSAYWSGALPEHVLTGFAETVSTPEGAAAWAAGLDDPARMNHLLTL
ncbi:hypothetical protein [Nocardiopsis metallicus]|uniref:Styrene monooxygenase StyA putative substrate binding domain-containing protein n=1 Tax=Nocardiopsis metallicus TaxID=179819 RepID=A0A840WG27_9ACTN|nr:hypothetical protein [Nocardiopsis metallicus]MBB5491961.1 hypothetical protein [Nocardiopsis metallicus]